jgi:hypothetical protein
MRLTLGLSGWTTNDWTSGLALDLLSGFTPPTPVLRQKIAETLATKQSASLQSLCNTLLVDEKAALGALFSLAKEGQVLHDPSHRLYRWRPILPSLEGAQLSGPPHPEALGAMEILREGKIQMLRDENLGHLHLRVGNVGGQKKVSVGVDGDGVIRLGECTCSWHHRAQLKKGPCRHILALRLSPPS